MRIYSDDLFVHHPRFIARVFLVHLLRAEGLIQENLEEVVSLAKSLDVGGAEALMAFNEIGEFVL